MLWRWDGEGNPHLAGTTDIALGDGPNRGFADAFVRRYDADGQETETRQFGTTDNDEARDLVLDGLGNMYVAGETLGVFPGQVGSGSADVYLRKYGVDGEEVGTIQLGTESADLASGVAVDGNGRVYLAGSTQGAFPGHANPGGVDAFIARAPGVPSLPESTTPGPVPAHTPTPTRDSVGGCNLAPAGARRVEAGWILLGLVWPGLALATCRRRR